MVHSLAATRSAAPPSTSKTLFSLAPDNNFCKPSACPFFNSGAVSFVVIIKTTLDCFFTENGGQAWTFGNLYVAYICMIVKGGNSKRKQIYSVKNFCFSVLPMQPPSNTAAFTRHVVTILRFFLLILLIICTSFSGNF